MSKLISGLYEADGELCGSQSALLVLVVVVFVLITGIVVPSQPAVAAETATYCYDALGRLTQVGKSGGPATGKKTTTAYDPAGNRSNQTTATGTIDCSATGGGGDPPGNGPSFSVNDASGTEGDVIVFTVTKTGTTTATYSVNYSTAHGTTAANDFTAVSGTLTFAPADVTKTVSVTTNADVRAEGTETFYLNLSAATGGATISDAQGVGTLFNDDSACATCRSAAEAPAESDGDDGQ